MLLKSLSLRNFRCFASLVEVPLHRLTVFIGENDAGKSAFLEAVALLLSDGRPSESDYYQTSDTQRAEELAISAVFTLEDCDTLPPEWRSGDGTTLEMTRTFSEKRGVRKLEVNGIGFCDGRFDGFANQTAGVQRQLLISLGLTPESNPARRIEQFHTALEEGRIGKQRKVLEVSFADIRDYLPLPEKVNSADYRDPDMLVRRTLTTVAAAALRWRNPSTEQEEPLRTLLSVKKRIHQALDRKVKEMTATIRTQQPEWRSVTVSEPDIDFARGVTPGSLRLDLGQGQGPQFVSAFGAGTKRKLWMGLLDWERNVQRQSRQISVIRMYDEPDVNLDYTAERKLFGNILDSVTKPQSRTQALVATHSVTLVDRAPAPSINLLRVDDRGERSVEYLGADDDAEVQQFLSAVGRSVGISNSALFYERAYIVVEGESEGNALPILYRNLYYHSMIQDGIVLIPLFGAGAWLSILRVLQRHRYETTFMLLDQDCTQPGSAARVTDAVLDDIGCPAEWRSTHCVYVGTKEFEDAFRTTDIVALLNQHWPRQDGKKWAKAQIEALRVPECKFSQALADCVRNGCVRNLRNSVRKPELATRLAHHCQKRKHIPAQVCQIFHLARTAAGCE